MSGPIPNGTPARLEPAKLGLALFITLETMFFAGLISAFLVFRLSPVAWPPEGQPRLPLAATAANTLVLLLSGLLMHLAFQALKAGDSPRFRRFLASAMGCGALFLAVQGTEWARLVRFGFTVHANVYGGFFYGLVGLHGLHVAGGLLALGAVGWRALQGAYSSRDLLGVELCRTYWFFVVGLWPVLFALIYF